MKRSCFENLVTDMEKIADAIQGTYASLHNNLVLGGGGEVKSVSEHRRWLYNHRLLET